jgi:eukaryotic-like serine/threonine-protein kinase
MGGDRATAPALVRLAALGAPDGPPVDEALRLLAHLRTTPHERRALELLMATDAKRPLPDPILVAVALALCDRGEMATARRVLARATSTAALMIRADLLAGELGPSGGRAPDVASALAIVERVLLRDVDWPGARERRARWLDELGVSRGAAPFDEGPPAMVPTPPDAPFELVREVGRGGAGTVYEARDKGLGRRVALKIYHRPERDRPQLLHEARVAVALWGAGIVRVLDVDPEHGWLAMQWAALGPLSAMLLARGGGGALALLPIDRWAVPLAAALARVHAAGWVHHDVKPANVLLRAPDVPLLGDFGTARRVGQPAPPGSVGYVSPERIAGRPSDPRDDVYGFGRILEDALEATGPEDSAGAQAEPDATRLRWRALAVACTGPEKEARDPSRSDASGGSLRPDDGRDLWARALEAATVRD